MTGNIDLDIGISRIVTIRKDFIYPGKPIIARGPRPHNSVVFAVEGKGKFVGNGQTLIIREGDFHFFRSGILNRSEALEDRPRSYIYANFETNDDDVFSRPPFSPVMQLSNRTDFEGDFHSLLSAWEGKGMGYLLQCRELLYRIFKTWLRNLVQDHPISRQYRRIQAAVLHIHNHYMQDISVEELAALCMLSARQCTRCFQDVYHKSPHEYLVDIRLLTAKEFLKDTVYNISEIADFTGYESIYSFSRIFKQYTGVSPSEWRKRNDELR
ncbi:AraC family transcriptional regulator [Spirochaetia bacterium]|nr:AraC family transcriptional regulator [Spirochaetia bacterium]